MPLIPGNNPVGGGTPDSIETSFVNQFREGFEQAYQQSVSIFDPFVEREGQDSEQQFFDRIGEAEEMREDTTRYGDNPTSEITHDRRSLTLRHFDLGKHIDEKDLIKVVSDPMNPYTTALLASGNRRRDDLIIDRYFGPAYIGKEGKDPVDFCVAATDGGSSKITVGEYSNGSSNPLVASAGRYTLAQGNKEGISVGVEYVDSGTPAASGVTLAKFKAVRTTMLRLEAIQQDTILNAFLTAHQFEELLGIEEVINADYSVRKSLAEGLPTVFMGFRFLHSERLPSYGNERRIPVFLPRAFKLTVARDLKGDIWRDPSKKKIPYIYFRQSIGGSRMWGEIAAEIRCAE